MALLIPVLFQELFRQMKRLFLFVLCGCSKVLFGIATTFLKRNKVVCVVENGHFRAINDGNCSQKAASATTEINLKKILRCIKMGACPFGSGFSLLLLTATFQDVGCGVTAAIPHAILAVTTYKTVCGSGCTIGQQYIDF